MSVERKVAVVTGASQGVGAALVKAYNERDYRRPAQIFVAVLGASNFTYAEASWTKEQHGYEGGLANPLSWDRTVEKFYWLSDAFADEDLRSKLIQAAQRLDTTARSDLMDLLVQVRPTAVFVTAAPRHSVIVSAARPATRRRRCSKMWQPLTRKEFRLGTQ